MTSSLKFVLGDRSLLTSRVRKTAADHSPIKARAQSAHSTKKPTNYVKSRGFSCRTNRDRFQTVGELYLGD